MDTKGIDQMMSLLRATATQAQAGVRPPGEAAPAAAPDFAQVLQNSIQQVNQRQQAAEKLAENFAAGDSGANLHEVMIELQKASVSFQEMVQVRNKLVTAYNEIMNMQV